MLPSPKGDEAPKLSLKTSGGERVRALSPKSTSKGSNPPSSDELINYSDVLLWEESEKIPSDHSGITSTASYDCHPTNKTVDRTPSSINNGAKEHSGNHDHHSECIIVEKLGVALIENKKDKKEKM